METSPSHSRLMPWLAVAVAVIVAAASLGNGFAYDDVPLIVDNAQVTALGGAWQYAVQPFWPVGGLYRPLTAWFLSLQWQLGGGSAAPFHLVSVLLHALVTGLVYVLARRVLDARLAILAALLFAVHPVHVEAVANVVGQSELLCTAFVLASVLVALRGAADGFTPARRAGVIAFGMMAAVSKEQGFVTPALVLAACGIVGAPRGREALRRAVPVVAVLALLLVTLFLLRASVLGGLAGDEPAAPLRGMSSASRMLVALGTVPEWARLLTWPARLSFDYSPPGYTPAAVPGLRHVVALLLVTALAWAALASRARMPAITLGVAWSAIALLPVSNIVPTGILVAERTLYLPSVGVVIAAAGAAALVWQRLASPAARGLALASVALLLLAAGVKSARRALVWKDNETLFRQVELEAPRNYRAHRTLALYLDRQGRIDEAAIEYRQSIALWGHDPRVYEDLAILLDRKGHDAEAVGVLQDGLALEADAPAMRSKLFYLQAAQGDWTGARITAAAGLALGDTMFAALVTRADSALSGPVP